MTIVNSELLRLARTRFNKAAFVPPGDPAAGAAPPGADPAAGMPPAGDPSMAGAAPPADPNAMAAVPAAPMDMSMGGAAAPAPAPAPAPSAPAQQKLKPEQMMQMIDYRLYNMQQQLTAIMNALGVQLPPEAIVLPPGSTSAPPAEAALPGGPSAPAPAPAAAGAGAPPAQLPQDVYAGQDPTQNGGVVPPIPPAKAAQWWQAGDESKAASYIGDPVARRDNEQPINLQVAASAATALYNSLMQNAR
jgi:hypothetical protein